jgi:hypothetical protein
LRKLEEHRTILREIADLAFSYGYDNSSIDFSKAANPDDIPKKEFIHACHEGYKLAQHKLIDEVIFYQELELKKKPKLKEARRERNKELEESIFKDLKIIEQRLNTLSHIADGIAWQLIGGQIHIAKRFFLQEKGQKRLKESNIEVAEEINQDPDNFALISDITNSIQIGDLLVVSKGVIGMMELKQGKVNEQISEFLENLEEQNKTIEDVDIQEDFDKKTAKQLKRVVRQKERMRQVTDLIKNDEGPDPNTGKHLKINTPVYNTEYFHENLEKMHQKLENKIWAYDVIEGCIHIGIYKGKGLAMAPFAIKKIISNDTDNFIIVNWMSIVSNISEPIFAKPLDPNFIIDILTDKVKVIFGINFDMVIELFNKLGLKSEWISEKNTMKLKQKHGSQIIFELNKRAIKMNTEIRKYILVEA